jgi:hypothetical protein
MLFQVSFDPSSSPSLLNFPVWKAIFGGPFVFTRPLESWVVEILPINQ